MQSECINIRKTSRAYLFLNSLIEEGGDWDRRNRLKVYQGLYYLSIRDFKSAANNFLDSISTFTSYELMDYKTFVTYTVLASMIALERVDLRTKVRRVWRDKILYVDLYTLLRHKTHAVSSVFARAHMPKPRWVWESYREQNCRYKCERYLRVVQNLPQWVRRNKINAFNALIFL